MILVRVDFTHYGPKDYQEGIHGYWILNDERQVLKAVDTWEWALREDEVEEVGLEDLHQGGENGSASIAARAEMLGLEVQQLPYDWGDTYPAVRAHTSDLLILFRGDFCEVVDTFYGCTQYSYDIVATDLSEDDAQTLLRLNIATDGRPL